MHTLAPSASPSSSRPRAARRAKRPRPRRFPTYRKTQGNTVYAVDIHRRVGVHVVGVQKWNDVHLERMHDDGQAATRELVGRCGRRARAFHLWEGVSPPPVVFAANPRAARYRAKRSRRQTSLGCNARGSRRAAALEGSATGAITLSRRGREVRQRARGGRHVPFYVDLLLVREQLRETERGSVFRSDRSGHRGLACVRTMASFAKGELRAFIRSRIEARASRRCASPLAITRRSPRFDSSRVPAIPRSRLFQNRRPRARPAGTTRFSSSPLSSPSPPSFLPSDSHLACHPTALSAAPNPDADSSRRGLAVTTPAGFAGAVGRYAVAILYLFLGIAIVDDFFTPSLELICERLNLSKTSPERRSPAAESSAPELSRRP